MSLFLPFRRFPFPSTLHPPSFRSIYFHVPLSLSSLSVFSSLFAFPFLGFLRPFVLMYLPFLFTFHSSFFPFPYRCLCISFSHCFQFISLSLLIPRIFNFIFIYLYFHHAFFLSLVFRLKFSFTVLFFVLVFPFLVSFFLPFISLYQVPPTHRCHSFSIHFHSCHPFVFLFFQTGICFPFLILLFFILSPL